MGSFFDEQDKARCIQGRRFEAELPGGILEDISGQIQLAISGAMAPASKILALHARTFFLNPKFVTKDVSVLLSASINGHLLNTRDVGTWLDASGLAPIQILGLFLHKDASHLAYYIAWAPLLDALPGWVLTRLDSYYFVHTQRQIEARNRLACTSAIALSLAQRLKDERAKCQKEQLVVYPFKNTAKGGRFPSSSKDCAKAENWDADLYRRIAVDVYGELFLSKPKAEQQRLRDSIKTTLFKLLHNGEEPNSKAPQEDLSIHTLPIDCDVAIGFPYGERVTKESNRAKNHFVDCQRNFTPVDFPVNTATDYKHLARDMAYGCQPAARKNGATSDVNQPEREPFDENEYRRDICGEWRDAGRNHSDRNKLQTSPNVATRKLQAKPIPFGSAYPSRPQEKQECVKLPPLTLPEPKPYVWVHYAPEPCPTCGSVTGCMHARRGTK